MADVLRALVTLNPTADPEHWYTNTWHFVARLGETRSAASTDFLDALDDFYQAIDSELSGLIGTGAIPAVKLYDLSEPPQRVPYEETVLSSLTTSSTTLPPEISCCVSYRGIYESGEPSGRRRGRIYIGPLHQAAFSGTTGRLAGTTVSVIATAAGAFLNASQASSTWAWVVYSRANDPGGSGVTGGLEVSQGWVDTDVDVQRRRSLSPGAKTTFS